MRHIEYFKFTLDNYKKLSKSDLLNILWTNMKTGTLESTLNKGYYSILLYLCSSKYSLDNFVRLSKYRLIKDNTYVAKFYHDDSSCIIYNFEMITKCKLAMYKIFDKLSEDDKNTLQTIGNYVTYDIKDEERLINQYVEYLTETCSSYVIEYVSNIDDLFDRLNKGPCRPEAVKILLKYQNDLINLFDTELGDCLKITTNYSNIELADLYNSLSI